MASVDPFPFAPALFYSRRMASGTIRPSVWVSAVAVLTAIAALVVYVEIIDSPKATAPSQPEASTDTNAQAGTAEANAAPAVPEWARREPEPEPYIENMVWGEIDLREAQAVMPDNLYWEWGAPTSDPAVLEAREQEKKRRNEEYGRVLSGDADESEVLAYFDYRDKLSSDYLEFAQWMRNRYGGGISEQFRGLLDLSIKLHTARLAELPHEREAAITRALERKRIREDWQREKEEFSGVGR